MSRNLFLSQSEHEAMNVPMSSKSGKATKPCHTIYENVFMKDQYSLQQVTKYMIHIKRLIFSTIMTFLKKEFFQVEQDNHQSHLVSEE